MGHPTSGAAGTLGLHQVFPNRNAVLLTFIKQVDRGTSTQPDRQLQATPDVTCPGARGHTTVRSVIVAPPMCIQSRAPQALLTAVPVRCWFPGASGTDIDLDSKLKAEMSLC